MITDEQLEIALTAFNVYYDGSNPITSLREALASYEASKPTLPKAMTEAPEMGSGYWAIDPRVWVYTYWEGRDLDFSRLKDGLCHATREDVKTVADAMLALVRA